MVVLCERGRSREKRYSLIPDPNTETCRWKRTRETQDKYAATKNGAGLDKESALEKKESGETNRCTDKFNFDENRKVTVEKDRLNSNESKNLLPEVDAVVETEKCITDSNPGAETKSEPSPTQIFSPVATTTSKKNI